MRTTILLFLLLASRAMAEPLSPPPAEVDARSGGSAPHEADYIYWRPHFPPRTDTPALIMLPTQTPVNEPML
jgi:hypothetical protein